jgi:hypothetical protein
MGAATRWKVPHIWLKAVIFLGKFCGTEIAVPFSGSALRKQFSVKARHWRLPMPRCFR